MSMSTPVDYRVNDHSKLLLFFVCFVVGADTMSRRIMVNDLNFRKMCTDFPFHGLN